jgi:hypothetical protein
VQDQSDHYTFIQKEWIRPALDATLPDQINPFRYDLLLGKASALIDEVRPLSASLGDPDGEVYYPLTVLNWEHKDGILDGTVRNDSGLPLHRVRVVVAELSKCGWREADIADGVLQPGQETTFSRSGYSQTCLGDDLVVVGQGAALP